MKDALTLDKGTDMSDAEYMDLNGDGKVDTLRLKWNNKDAVVVDEAGCFLWKWHRDKIDPAAMLKRAFSLASQPPYTWNPIRAGWGTYMIFVDNDGDGKFDGKEDFYYRAVDLNDDGMPEIEFFHGDTLVGLVVNVNGEREFKYFDFENFHYYGDQPGGLYRCADGSRYYHNVHGSGFLHDTYIDRLDLPLGWEVPIAWYDLNNDGFTEMVMRIANMGNPDNPGAQEAEFAFELNGELSRRKWHSLDFQLTFTAYGRPGLPLADFADNIAPLTPPAFARRFFGEGWRQLADEQKRICLPFIDGYRIATDFSDWTGVWMLWDEDNDDNRWEEMFSRYEEPVEGAEGRTGLYQYSDRIGDRVEIDSSFGGEGKLYIGSFDGKIHLYRADRGEWTIDYYGQYKGAIDRKESMEGPEPPVGLVHDVVRYHDTNGNGFIDLIEYGTAEYGREDQTWNVSRTVNLLEFADDENPCPDVQPLFDLKVDVPPTNWKVENWDGNPMYDWTGTAPYEAHRAIKAVYEQLCARQWVDARMMYDTAVYLGINRSEHLPECSVAADLRNDEKLLVKDVRVLRGYASLTDACSLREKYHYGYWLKEKILMDILDAVDGETAVEARRLYYTGKIRRLCRILRNSES